MSISISPCCLVSDYAIMFINGMILHVKIFQWFILNFFSFDMLSNMLSLLLQLDFWHGDEFLFCILKFAVCNR